MDLAMAADTPALSAMLRHCLMRPSEDIVPLIVLLFLPRSAVAGLLAYAIFTARPLHHTRAGDAVLSPTDGGDLRSRSPEPA